VATDENGEVTQTLDYYPYGSQRITAGSFSEQRRFIGEEYDGDTEFSYLNARYYQGPRGQFMSQDPASRNTPEQFLADPQQLNTYAYSKNNPIRFLDQSGNITIEFSRPINNQFIGWAASHNAIAGYNVPGFPKGVMTIAGYDSGGPAAYNGLVMEHAQSNDSALSKQDFEIAQQIFKGDTSGTKGRGFTLIKDFGGLTEEEYWKKLIDAGVRINLQGVPYSVISQNSHSGLNTSKNYANPSSSPYQPTHPWLGLPWLTPASGNNVLQGSQSGSGSSGSTAFGLSAGTEIGPSNVGAFVTFIKQFF
jgi:RHS repeat-associated protein